MKYSIKLFWSKGTEWEKSQMFKQDLWRDNSTKEVWTNKADAIKAGRWSDRTNCWLCRPPHNFVVMEMNSGKEVYEGTVGTKPFGR